MYNSRLLSIIDSRLCSARSVREIRTIENAVSEPSTPEPEPVPAGEQSQMMIVLSPLPSTPPPTHTTAPIWLPGTAMLPPPNSLSNDHLPALSLTTTPSHNSFDNANDPFAVPYDFGPQIPELSPDTHANGVDFTDEFLHMLQGSPYAEHFAEYDSQDVAMRDMLPEAAGPINATEACGSPPHAADAEWELLNNNGANKASLPADKLVPRDDAVVTLRELKLREAEDKEIEEEDDRADEDPIAAAAYAAFLAAQDAEDDEEERLDIRDEAVALEKVIVHAESAVEEECEAREGADMSTQKSRKSRRTAVAVPKLSHTSTSTPSVPVPKVNVPQTCPDWVQDAVVYFDNPHLGSNWLPCVQAWVDLEVTLRLCSAVRHFPIDLAYYTYYILLALDSLGHSRQT